MDIDLEKLTQVPSRLAAQDGRAEPACARAAQHVYPAPADEGESQHDAIAKCITDLLRFKSRATFSAEVALAMIEENSAESTVSFANVDYVLVKPAEWEMIKTALMAINAGSPPAFAAMMAKLHDHEKLGSRDIIVRRPQPPVSGNSQAPDR
jgi:hypothetical protein